MHFDDLCKYDPFANPSIQEISTKYLLTWRYCYTDQIICIPLEVKDAFCNPNFFTKSPM